MRVKGCVLFLLFGLLCTTALQADPVAVEYNYSGKWDLQSGGTDPYGLDGASFDLSFQIPWNAAPGVNTPTWLTFGYSGVVTISGAGLAALNGTHAVSASLAWFQILGSVDSFWPTGWSVGSYTVGLPSISLLSGTFAPFDGHPPVFSSSDITGIGQVFGGGSFEGWFAAECVIASGTAVPEPSTLLLLSGGLGLVALFRKRC